MAAAGAVGGRRFWITVFCFALANLAIWLAYHHVQHPSRPKSLLLVESFTPGDGATLAADQASTEPDDDKQPPALRTPLLWHFNLDLALRQPDGALPPDAPAGIIRPFVPGRWTWADAHTLCFVPKDPWPLATRFKVTLPERLATPDGFTLPSPYATTVQTPPLTLTDVRQAAFDEQDRLLLELVFNDTVNPADVLEHLQLRGPLATNVRADAAARQKTLRFSHYGQDGGRIVRVLTQSIPELCNGRAQSISLTLTKGLTGASGPLPSESDEVRNVPIASRLLATGIERIDDAPNFKLRINFNNAVDVNVIKPLLSVEPAAPFTVSQRSDNSVELNGPFACGTRYTVKIAAGPVKDENKYPQPTTFSVVVPDREPAVWLTLPHAASSDLSSLKLDRLQGYLGSQGNRTLLACAVNVPAIRVKITRVYENNLVLWRNRTSRWSWSTADEFSHPLIRKRIPLEGKRNQLQNIPLRLDELLGPGPLPDGAYQVTVSADDGTTPDEEDDDSDNGSTATVTLSDIALTAKRTPKGLFVWAASLQSARPLESIAIRVYSNKNQLLAEAQTDADGVARLECHPAPGEKPAIVIAARPPAATQGPSDGQGLTWLSLDATWDLSSVSTNGRAYLRQGYEAFLYADRDVYRPGETLLLRAIVRGSDGKRPDAFPLRWVIQRPDGHPWKSQTVSLDADGAAEWKVTLPADLPTGGWAATLALPGNDPGGAGGKKIGEMQFNIEEFVPERIKASLTLDGPGLASPTPRLAMNRGPLHAAIQADYLFGQPAADLHAQVVARLVPATFSSPDWAGWQFGDAAEAAQVFANERSTARRMEGPALRLDAGGRGQTFFRLQASDDQAAASQPAATAPAKAQEDQEENEPTPAPWTFRGPWKAHVVATVQETGGRAVTASQTLLADALDAYIGLRPRQSGPAHPDQPLQIDVALVTPAGTRDASSADLDATLYRETWNNTLMQHGRHFQYNSVRQLRAVDNPASFTVRLEEGKGLCELRLPEPGSYVLVLRQKQTGAFTAVNLYATDDQEGGWQESVNRENPERLDVRLMPADDAPPADKEKLWKTGEKAKVIIRSPFAGQLLLTIETDQIVKHKVVPMEQSAIEIPIEIPEGCYPNAYLSASVIRAVRPDLPWRVHRAYGVAPFKMDPAVRRLAITLDAPAEMRPGRTLDARVRVLDPAGQPAANAAVALAAVDEGVCRLTDFATPDPLLFFSAKRALAVSSSDLYGDLMPEAPRQSAVGGDSSGDGDYRYRSPLGGMRVKPIALVSPIVHTDADGVADVHFQVPAFNGTLRLMAVGYREDCFGDAARSVLVRSPLMIQTSWPRFAAPGDSFHASLVAFNNSPAEGKPQILVDLGKDGPLAFQDSSESAITLNAPTLKANSQASFGLTIKAGNTAGIAHVRIHGTLADEQCDEELEIPIRPASPRITRGDYLRLTPGKPFTPAIAPDMLAGSQKITLRLTPRPELRLPEGLDYLDRYPYGCLEQTVSGCFPLLYLSDVGPQIAPGLFDRERIALKVQTGITRLLAMQNAKGGLGMWPSSKDPWPWGSVYAAHFLVEAQAAGHPVPEDFRHSLLSYLRQQLRHAPENGDDLELQAYACHVLALAGQPDRSSMNRLAEVIAAREKTPDREAGLSQARFHLALAWLAANRRDIAADMLPQQLPTPRKQRAQGGNVGSPVRDQAMILQALLTVRPEHPAIPALAEKLAAAAGPDGWGSTQDTAFAVMALGHYFRLAKNDRPYQRAFLEADGHLLVQTAADTPLRWTGATLPGRDWHLRLEGPADAAGYLAWTQEGIPTRPPEPADHGLKVRRAYLQSKPGTPFQSGQLVQVEITLETSTTMENLVLEDLLPAGFEVENQALSSGARAAEGENQPIGEFSVAQLQIRDDRVVVMGDAPAGLSRFYYLARAVTPGQYIAPPVRAECMYDPSLNSLYGGGNIQVIPPEVPASQPAVAHR